MNKILFILPITFNITACFSPSDSDSTTEIITAPTTSTASTSGKLSDTTSTTVVPTTSLTSISSTASPTTLSDTAETSETFGTSGITTGITPSCGDGLLQATEECDDALPSELDVECHNCFYDRKIFVSSTYFRADIIYTDNEEKLLDDLYKICADLAISAEINNFGFRPIINFSNYSWIDTFNVTNGRYILTNNAIFAENFNDIFLQNAILNAPNFNEYGEEFPNYVWTGSVTNNNCSNWSDPNLYGDYGRSYEVQNWYKNDDLTSCSIFCSIYCIQDLLPADQVAP